MLNERAKVSLTKPYIEWTAFQTFTTLDAVRRLHGKRFVFSPDFSVFSVRFVVNHIRKYRFEAITRPSITNNGAANRPTR
jgi:hypothetical protein